MRYIKLAILVLPVSFCLSCHKSAESSRFPIYSGPYVETSPIQGGIVLNFLDSNTVVVSDPQSYLAPQPSSADTGHYFLAPGPGGTRFNFIMRDGAGVDTVSDKYGSSGFNSFWISFECPSGVFCPFTNGPETKFLQ